MRRQITRWRPSPGWISYSLIAIAFGLAIAALRHAPLTWDGANYFFNIADTRAPLVEHGRVADRFLHYPVAWVLSLGGSVPLALAVFNFVHILTPLVALALSWWVVRKTAPQLMLWPMLCIGLALLPGQINFISEGIKAEQLMWPLLLALVVGLPPRTVPVAIVLAIAIYALHPVAAPILASCGLAAMVLAVLRKHDRSRLGIAGLVLVGAGVVRFVGVNSGYEQSEMTGETQSRQWSNGATGLPLFALVASAFIALSILVQPWLPARLRPWITRVQVGAILVGTITLVLWAADPSKWWEALEFRGPAFWISMIAAGCLFLHVLIGDYRKTSPGPVPAIQIFSIAVGFSLVISVQSVAWSRVVNGLEDQLNDATQACIAREDLPGYPYTPLNIWATNALSLVMQGRSPTRISMTTEECHRANQSGQLFIGSSLQDHTDGHIDVSGIRANLPEATTCTWQETVGWHQPEALIPDTWRWTESSGSVDITMDEAGAVLVQGQFRTLQAPNTIRLIRDGVEIDSFEIPGLGSEPFTTIPLDLPEGTTTISFVSDNRATVPPGDGRPLAISVWNLDIRPIDGSSPCLRLEPQ